MPSKFQISELPLPNSGWILPIHPSTHNESFGDNWRFRKMKWSWLVDYYNMKWKTNQLLMLCKGLSEDDAFSLSPWSTKDCDIHDGFEENEADIDC